jgi:hypothetical protein
VAIQSIGNGAQSCLSTEVVDVEMNEG